MSAEELPHPGATDPGTPEQASPQDLRLVSVSMDGKQMTFVDPSGQEFTVEVDDRLRAAIPADSHRRSESPVSDPKPTLRPRDIQNRIRAGASAEEVAEAAGTSVEKIQGFAGPVLAERAHMAERAQGASIRRPAGESGSSARTLGEAVGAQLGTFYTDPDEVVTWDSYRRPDGKWKLNGIFDLEQRSGIAELTYDAAGNYVGVDNDDARWLIGDLPEEPVVDEQPPAPVDDLHEARRRRAAAPPAPTTPPPAEPALPPVADVSANDETIEQPLETDTPLEAYLLDDTPPKAPAKAQAEPEPAPEPVAEPTPAEKSAAKKKSARRKRASVPSWDEIMFGGGKPE